MGGMLGRYLLREYTKIFFLCLLGLLGLFLLVEFLEHGAKLVSHGADAKVVVRFLLYRIPHALVHMVPLALLLAAVLTGGLFARHREFVAARALGINPHRLALPVLAFALGASFLLILFNASLVPRTYHRSEDIKWTWLRNEPRTLTFQNNHLWVRVDDSTLANIALADPNHQILFGVDLYRLDPQGDLLERIYARRARTEGGRWILEVGTRWRFGGTNALEEQPFRKLPLEMKIPLPDASRFSLNPREIPFRDLYQYIQHLRKEGYPVQRFLVDLQGKLAFPLAGALLALMGLSFSMMEFRGGLSLGVGLTLLAGFFYWMCYTFFLSLGYSGHLPAWLAPWMANLLFALLGGVLFWRIHR